MLIISEELILQEDEKGFQNLGDIMFESNPCEPNLILNKIKQTRLWNDKKKIMTETIKKCGTKQEKRKKGEKGTRKMSGWNCYLKKCSNEPNMDFQKCMGDKNRKQKEYEPNKDIYAKKAGDGCK